MTLIEILQGLQNGSFRQGEILESEGVRFEILSDAQFKVIYPSQKYEIRKLFNGSLLNHFADLV